MGRGYFPVSLVCVLVVYTFMADVTSAGRCYTSYERPIYGVPVRVSLGVNNQIQPPYIKNWTTLQSLPQTWLVNLLNNATDGNFIYTYTATYYTRFGYFISAINNLTGTAADKTYWSISDARTGQLLPCGVSSFVPDDNDVILFNFTTYN